MSRKLRQRRQYHAPPCTQFTQRSFRWKSRPLHRGPHSVVPKTPAIGVGIPHQVSPGRPRRWRWLRRRPRRWGAPRSPADQPARPTLVRASRTLPVVAVIRVRVVAPARIPWITRAPVVAGRRSWCCLGDAADQSGSEQGQTTHQRACAQPNPRCRSLHGSHVPIISFADRIPQRFGDTAGRTVTCLRARGGEACMCTGRFRRFRYPVLGYLWLAMLKGVLFRRLPDGLELTGSQHLSGPFR